MSAQLKVLDIAKLTSSCRDCSLATLCLPCLLRPPERQRFESIVRRRRPLRRGEHLFRSGDGFGSLFIIKAGSMKSYSITADGSEQILGFHLPGELIGLDAFDANSHLSSAVALETTAICELPVTLLEGLARALPGLQQQVNRLTGKQIANDHQTLLLLGKKGAEERLATFLLSLSARLKRRGLSAYEFNLSMSRHEISNYLGLAMETVSRLLSRFQNDDLIGVDQRHVRILDAERLRKLAGAADDLRFSNCPQV